MQLLEVDASLETRWDEYVEPRANSVTELYAWRHVLESVYKIKAHFFAVDDAGRFKGVLGLYEYSHPLFGHYLTTAAFSNDGGFYFDTAEASAMLLAQARQLADRLGVDYLLIRTRGPELEEFVVDRHYCTATLSLEGDLDDIWFGKIKGKTRNQVRRGQKEGFVVHTGHEQLRDFSQVFQTHMRDLGSPAHGRRFYEAITEHLGNRAQYLVVKDKQTVVAGALIFEVNGVASNYHTVALKKFNRRCPNYLLYWHMLKTSHERGNRLFDMGRSELDGPNIRFKQNWGTKVIELTYNYYLTNLKVKPHLDPGNAKYALPIAIWKRLPVRATRFLGPLLIKGIA